MRKKLFCIFFVVMAAGMVVVGCGDSPDQEGIHAEGGVHGTDGNLDKSDPGQGAQLGENSNDVVQISSSRELITKTFALTDFDKVEARMFDVDILHGDSFAVTINIEKNALDHVVVAVEDRWLKIGLDPGKAYNSADIVLKARVTMPNLTDIDLSLSSVSTVSGFENAEDISIDLDLSSSLTGDWIAADCDISLALGSHLSLTGRVQNLSIAASGNSVADVGEFQVQNAIVHAEGSSQVTVRPEGDLVTTADSSSTVIKN